MNVIDKEFQIPHQTPHQRGIWIRSCPSDWVVTGEFTYSKDINATYMANQNLNETKSGFAIANGGDTRQRFNSDPTATSGYNASNTFYSGTPTRPPCQTPTWAT